MNQYQKMTDIYEKIAGVHQKANGFYRELMEACNEMAELLKSMKTHDMVKQAQADTRAEEDDRDPELDLF